MKDTTGEKIVAALRRMRPRMTQRKLAEATGLSVTTINYIINGRRKNPGLDTIKSIADVLGCNPFDLMGD